MANSYLNRTLGTPTNSKKFTFSAWVKKSNNKSGGHYLLDTVGQSAGSENPIAFDGDQKFRVGEYTGSNVYNYRSNAQFRDVNGWYHCVVQGDSTQSTASDRVKLYVNNQLLTSDTNEYPSQDYDFIVFMSFRPDCCDFHICDKETARRNLEIQDENGNWTHNQHGGKKVNSGTFFIDCDPRTVSWMVRLENQLNA